MIFNPCFIVPSYNHSRAARVTVGRLSVHGLPIFLIDDGSVPEEAAILAELAGADALVRLIILPVNSGKGGAVMAGLRAALAQGFTHGMQVDADGQHDLGVLDGFFEAGRGNPDAMVCGYPVYDESIPLGRKLGRHLTHFWVWVETWSFSVKDSMCGFRLYPLAQTCDLLERKKLPKRMNFDIEIMVRLHWQGVNMLWRPVRVTYPVDGRSHFRPFEDNARISWMHTRLVCAMPWNLTRRALGLTETPGRGQNWARMKERGSSWGLAFTAWVHRYLGRWLALPIAPLVATYFFLTGRRAREATLDYLRRLRAFAGEGTPEPGWFSAWRLYLTFGFAAHDKMTAWLNPSLLDKIDFPDLELLREARENGRGALIIGAHLGNLEMMRAVAARYGFKGFHAVVHFANAAKFTGTIQKAAPDSSKDLIHVSSFGPETAMRLRQIIDRGECVVIVGDRTPASENGQTVVADFLGAPAEFPRGPFILAAALECPVYLFFCVASGGGYKVYAEKFADKVTIPRASRQESLAGLADRYARRLEQLCVAYPLQWFNFFDFWRIGKQPAPHAPKK
jgi:predicted LPLAT superfamily acyltransferase